MAPVTRAVSRGKPLQLSRGAAQHGEEARACEVCSLVKKAVVLRVHTRGCVVHLSVIQWWNILENMENTMKQRKVTGPYWSCGVTCGVACLLLEVVPIVSLYMLLLLSNTR